MKLIKPITVTDTQFVTSNVPEDDHPVWLVGTTYAALDRVIVAGTTHKIYESVASSNTGNDPTTDNGTNWTEISATNRWRAFDLVLGDTVTNSATIAYGLLADTPIDGIAFFGLAAGTVQVVVRDLGASIIYDVTKDLIDSMVVVDWLTFYFGGIDFDSEALFTGVPGFTGNTIEITIASPSGTISVSQIVLGQVKVLGETLTGTEIGIEDFSTKTRDSFGNATIVERAFIDNVDFRFVLNTRDARDVKRILTSVRAQPAVYFVNETDVSMGTTVFGYFRDFSIPLNAGGKSTANLEIEGLV